MSDLSDDNNLTIPQPPKLRRKRRLKHMVYSSHVTRLPLIQRQEAMVKQENKIRKALDVTELQQLAREHAADFMNAMLMIVQDPEAKASDKIAATDLVLNRAYGRPTQTNVNSNVNIDARPSELTQAQLEQRVARALQRVEELAAGAAEPAPSPQRPRDLRGLN